MDPTQIALNSVGAAAVIPHLIEALKNWPRFKLLTPDTATLNRWVGVLSALAVSVGVSYQWNAAERTLLIHIPTLVGALTVCWHATVQWGLQQYVYKTSVSPRSTAAVQPAALPTQGVVL